MRRYAFVLVWLAHVPNRVLGDEPSVAQRHYEAARGLYRVQRYREALEELHAGRAVAPRPEFDFDIGLCDEALGRWGEAADAYDRFLAAVAPIDRPADLPARVATLRARARQKERRSRSLRDAAIAMSAVTVATGATWAGLLGAVGAQYDDRKASCAGACTDAQIHDLRVRQDASFAFAAVAAASLVVDVGLWVAYAKGRAR